MMFVLKPTVLRCLEDPPFWEIPWNTWKDPYIQSRWFEPNRCHRVDFASLARLMSSDAPKKSSYIISVAIIRPHQTKKKEQKLFSSFYKGSTLLFCRLSSTTHGFPAFCCLDCWDLSAGKHPIRAGEISSVWSVSPGCYRPPLKDVRVIVVFLRLCS